MIILLHVSKCMKSCVQTRKLPFALDDFVQVCFTKNQVKILCVSNTSALSDLIKTGGGGTLRCYHSAKIAQNNVILQGHVPLSLYEINLGDSP